jgi:hypothetical protein
MPVDNLNVVDSISIDKNGRVALTIFDHLEWDAKNEHLVILQKKIHKYMDFIEEGELSEKYPESKDKKIVINIMTKYFPNKDGEVFLRNIKQILGESGYELQLMYNEKF